MALELMIISPAKACWAKLAELPEACEMLPFVRLFYGEQSIFLWHDEKGRQHQIFQGEGGEQGDP